MTRRPASSPHPGRGRPPTAGEIDAIPWLGRLAEDDRVRASHALVVWELEPGALLCRIGRRPTHWPGVVNGLLKMSNDNADGTTLTYSGLPPGGWFSEGTVIKGEPYRYNIQALRHSVVAALPVAEFQRLLDHSIGFNRFVMGQLNERLGQFISAREVDRLIDPDARVARHLAALFHPILFPGVGDLLRITQQELAWLVGLSRQRVNQALRTLERHGLIAIEYGGLRVLDPSALRTRLTFDQPRVRANAGPRART